MNVMAKIAPKKPLLILLYGFPGAGKTFFARQLSEYFEAAHLQGDRIRSELFENPRYDQKESAIVSQLMDYMTGEFLNAGLSVIYDASVYRAVQRRALRDLARRARASTLLVWLQIDIESAFARGARRDRRKADDRYSAQLDRTTFNEIIGHMQNPAAAENYVVISGKHTFKTQLNSVIRRLHDMGAIDAEAAAAHVAKPGMVNLVPNANGGRVDLSRRSVTIR